MTIHPKEKTFKKIGASIEQAFLMLSEGINIVDCLDQAADEKERELYTTLAALQVHNSWHSIIRIFRRIATEVDNGVPKGTGAQRLLIEQMLLRTNERPGILSLRHREVAQKIGAFHRDFRNAKNVQHSRREVIDFIEMMNDEIVPSVLENVRLLALASPGGGKLVAYLQPKTSDAGTVQFEDMKRA